MDQTFDVSTTLWIIGTLVAIVMALIGTLWAILRNSIRDAFDTIERERGQREAAVKDVNERLAAAIKDSNCKLDAERDARVLKHDASIERVFGEIEKVKDRVSDLDVTVAGFGSVYVTRAEIQQRGK